MVKINISKGIIGLQKNKILYIIENVQLGMKSIFSLLCRYTLNIMKKIEFELVRDEGVYVKVTDEQKEIIKKLAKCQKRSTSDFIKWVIFSKYIDDFIK